jgi:uncharacterized protein (DUF2249 family)/quercetin dioxygenase-like cupin family protein
MAGHAATEKELDVRPLAKPDKHPTVFATYAALPVGASFVLVSDHDPEHLREEFESDHGGSFGWEYLARDIRNWRIRITKLTSTPLPRILASTTDLAAQTGQPGVSGAVWKLEIRDRDLDSNIIALPPEGVIDAHAGPDLDVLIHVLGGSGTLASERGTLDLEPGVLAWLPRRSMRQLRAGPGGLRYLTVHRRRQALVLDPSMRPVG